MIVNFLFTLVVDILELEFDKGYRQGHTKGIESGTTEFGDLSPTICR